MSDEPNRAERMLAKSPGASAYDINSMRRAKLEATPGSEVYNRCEGHLAEMEEREPRYVLHR